MERANAAQLAARNIKARPRSRRTGSKPPDSTSQPQFAPMQTPSQNGGGGLFGGSIQAPGEFNFSAPAQGLNLPPLSFGARANTMSTPSQDTPESEGRFAGDDRATKKRFGGPSTISQSNSPFQTSNPFGQSQPSNPFGSTQQPSGGSIFPFGGSQQSGTSGINFNSGSTTPANSANNPFSFQSPSQPAPTTPSTSFGPGPFNFNQQSSQTADGAGKFEFIAGASSPFGPAPAVQQDKPATSPFLFGQTSGQPSSSGITFGSTPAPTPPKNSLFDSTPTTNALQTSSLFGNPTSTAPPPQSNSFFGSTKSSAPPASSVFSNPNPAPPQDKSTSSPFFFSQASAPPSSSGISFSSVPAPAPPTSNFFGSTQPQQPTQPANSFGSSIPQSTSSSNPFAHLNAPTSPVSNVFGKEEQKTAVLAASNVFGVPNPAQASTTNNLFGTPTQTPTTPSKPTLFGQQPEPSPASNVFGNLKSKSTASTTESNSQSQQASVGSAFGNIETKSANDLFGNLNKPVDQSVTQPKVNGSSLDNDNDVNSSRSVFSKYPSAANTFGAPKSLFNTSPAKQAEAVSGLRQSATPQASGNIFSALKPLEAPASARQPPPTGMFPSLEQMKSPQKLSGSPSATPASSKEASRRELLRRDEASIRQQMKEASEMTDESVAHLISPRFDGFQRKAFYQGYRMQALNNAMSNFFASVHPDEDATRVLEFYMQQRGLIMGNSQSLRRKADEESDEVDYPGKPSKQSVQSISNEPHEKQSKRKLHDEEDQENENPSKRTRQVESSNSARGVTNGDINFNGQASAFVNGNSFQPSAGPPPSSETLLKRKADNQITKDSEQRSPLRNMTPKTNGFVEANSSGSSTSNIFRSILDNTPKSPVKASPERKMAGLPEISKSDAPRTNAFANLPGVSSPTKSTNRPFSMFGTKATSAISSASQNPFAPNAISGTSNAFTPKSATPSTLAAGSISTDQKPNVLKPPTFNTKTNFLEQFAQGAKETEEKELQKAIDDDYDSDDDLEEFKAKWRAERIATRKEIEDSAKTSKGFILKSTLAPPSDSTSTIKEGSKPANMAFASFAAAAPSSTMPSSLFGQIASSQASNSISSSVNSSRTPTPAFGSSTGSVLDGNAPTNPVKFGNIFAHLSDADSGKGADADDESEDETSDAEGDSEKKDPTYQPNGESASGPGTPAEETGPGLASAKKANPVASAFSSTPPSGTSTPTGGLFGRIGTADSNGGTTTPKSLFDRIARDSSGNIVRHTFTDEKENTQPDKANPFGDIKNAFNKSTGAPSDNTWKPDSPIRFGSATPRQDDQDSAPTVSVTAATPTKTGSPSNIFGGLNKTAESAPTPLSNLFGNIGGETKSATPLSNFFGTSSNTTKSTPANVGFAFGASSTTSSLFPSAAASATTSRATTPGGTTDGDGDNSGDGDAEQEKGPDFDLSSVGPGGENEEVIHEIRAKALKFSQNEGDDKGSRWESKGVGPLRVLKHTETGVSRVLLRMDPSGVVILNKGLLPGVKYEPKEKTVKFLAAGDNGKGLETWILQVKSPEIAEALSEVLEANKPT